MKYGYSLYCEGFDPRDLVNQAVLAEQYGFDFVVISDHFHPWLSSQKHAGFAWSILGSIAQATNNIGIATMVTCPIIRYHPAIVAQMAATVGVLSDGRFTLGLGTGEQLNEHVVGNPWPSVSVRREMLEEAVGIFHKLWSGEFISFKGEYFDVVDAKIFDLPVEPIPYFIAAGGEESAALAAQLGGGLCNTSTDEKVIQAYRAAGGDEANTWCQVVLAWSTSESDGLKDMYDQFRFSAIGGWKVQSELPNVVNFDAATAQISPDTFVNTTPHGPRPEAFVKELSSYKDAGFKNIALMYPGKDTQGFMKFWKTSVLPQLEKNSR